MIQKPPLPLSLGLSRSVFTILHNECYVALFSGWRRSYKRQLTLSRPWVNELSATLQETLVPEVCAVFATPLLEQDSELRNTLLCWRRQTQYIPCSGTQAQAPPEPWTLIMASGVPGVPGELPAAAFSLLTYVKFDTE